jgi:hypothetical protein
VLGILELLLACDVIETTPETSIFRSSIRNPESIIETVYLRRQSTISPWNDSMLRTHVAPQSLIDTIFVSPSMVATHTE